MRFQRLPLALLLTAFTLSGCAMKQHENPDSGWVGEYQSAPEMGLTTHLTLAADHAATTTYHYLNGDPDLVETGNWKQSSINHIQVNMITHDGHPLKSERIYSYDPATHQLTATQETINGKSYPLAANGLVLTRH